jgi:hypothetical protein
MRKDEKMKKNSLNKGKKKTKPPKPGLISEILDSG